jgi:FKBP-type peptidyl-prolyl cis-trans isomerase FkpA/FKBP-type peptidyl-prolyl cis-trans isomerase FklB
MRHIIGIVLAVLASGLGQAAELKTDEQRMLYALGVLLSREAAGFYLTPEELAFVQQGFVDGALNNPLQVEASNYLGNLQLLRQQRTQAIIRQQQQAGEAYLAKAAQAPGATKTASGLVVQTIKPGTGPSPKASDRVKVHYHGTLTDGKVFDSSVQRGEPATFPLTGVIPCWTEGLQLMKVGGKSRLICPANLAYGDRSSPPIKPGSTLIFDVELLEILK